MFSLKEINEDINLHKILLKKLATQDQNGRGEYAKLLKKMDWEKARLVFSKTNNKDVDDLFGDKERIKIIKRQFDKFKFDKFDAEDWRNFWLIIQHADFDRELQTQVLQLLKKFLGTNSSEYKYLFDRLSCAMTGKQKFGTQDICDKSK